jgi:hypothetical protein
MTQRRVSKRLLVFFAIGLFVCATMAWIWDQSSQKELAAVERLSRQGFSFTFHAPRLAPLRNVLATVGLTPKLGQRARTAHFAGDLSTVNLADLALISDLRSLTLIEGDEDKDNRAIVTDALLQPLNCRVVEEVVVTAKSGLTDRFLERFSGSTAITTIIVDDSLVTDAGLKHLRGCPNLSGIAVEGCAVTNAGVEAVIDLPALNRLFLDRTQVDSGILKILPRSQTMEYVYLCGTTVTVQDAIEFTRERSILMRVGDPTNPHEVQLGEAVLAFQPDPSAEVD